MKKQGDRFPPCFHCKKKNHTNRPNVECSACHQKGHAEKECKAKKSEASGSVVLAEESGEAEELLFMARIEGTSFDKNVWLIDSGCSNNFTRNKHFFIELDKSFNA